MSDPLLTQTTTAPGCDCGGVGVCPPCRDEDHEELRHTLSSIRGLILNASGLDNLAKLLLINEIVGEALYGDFPGTLARAYEDGTIKP